MTDAGDLTKRIAWCGTRFLWWSWTLRMSSLPLAGFAVVLFIASAILGAPVWWLGLVAVVALFAIALFSFVRWRQEKARDATVTAVAALVVRRYESQLRQIPELERIVAAVADGKRPLKDDLIGFGAMGIAERLHERFPGLSTDVWDVISDVATGQKVGALRIAKLVGREGKKRIRRRDLPKD